MPTTEHATPSKHTHTDEQIPTDMPTRDEETEAKIKATEELLDEIDSVLETETIEHALTLSDLIRRGSELHPQVFGTLRDYGSDGECLGTCALGAAEDEAKRLGLL